MAMTAGTRVVVPHRPRVAIVGAGLMGRWHAEAAKRGGGQLVAVVDPDTPRRERLAARFAGCRAFPDISHALQAVDLVHLCTPADTHVSLAREILEAGRHVIVEKPVAPSADQTSSLLQIAEARGVLICPVYQFGFQDGASSALRRLGTHGTLLHVDITICSAGAEQSDAAGRAHIAGEILPHPLSLLQRWLPGDVSEREWVVVRSAPGEIRALTRDGAVTVSILVSMSGRPTVNRAVLIGTAATVEVDLFHGYAVTLRGPVSRAQKVAQPFVRAALLGGGAALNLARRAWRRQPAYPGLQELVAQFYRAVQTGGPSPIPARETLAIAQALDRLGSQRIVGGSGPGV